MGEFNDDPGAMESGQVRDRSPEDTLTSWSLEDFLDIVPRSTPRDDHGSIDVEVLGELI